MSHIRFPNRKKGKLVNGLLNRAILLKDPPESIQKKQHPYQWWTTNHKKEAIVYHLRSQPPIKEKNSEVRSKESQR